MSASILDRHLIYVTGKGGVGRTTVAAAIGLAAAAQGRNTIVCEVAEQHHMSRVFSGVPSDREVQLDDRLYALTVDPQQALEEWLGRQVGGPALKVLIRSHAFQYFVAAAPGAKEMVTIAKVWEIGQGHRWTKTNRTYDTVVVDAPATGHALAMLRTPRTIGQLARAGPIQRQAGKVRDMLADPEQTAYVAVALPEEMPVTETLELQDQLPEAVGIGLDAIVVNGVYPERFKTDEVERLRAIAALDGRAPGSSAAVRAALGLDQRARSQRAHLRRLRRDARAPVLTLPFLFGGDLGLPEYQSLADRLARRL